MKTRNTLSVLSTMLFIAALFCGCNPELELSGVNYYYTIHEYSPMFGTDYLLQNDQLTNLPNNATMTEISAENHHMRYESCWYNDCYLKGNDTYYVGTHRIMDQWVENWSEVKEKVLLSEVFIERNGVRKYFSSFFGVSSGVCIFEQNDTIYYLFQATYETGDTDQLGNPHHGQGFYVSINGDEPIPLADNQEQIYDTRKVVVEKIKKIGDKFYIVGTKDNVAIFCEASQLRMPYYLSNFGGGAYDLIEYNGDIYVCGSNEKKACLWKDRQPIELSVPAGTEESEARCMAVVGEDLYIGGRINERPAIWKNGELIATHIDFPPVVSEYFVTGHDYALDGPKIKEEFGWVCAMEIIGDTIYSIVETSNWANDHKRFALEWYFRNGKVYYKDKYDLVEMLRNGQIVLQDIFYSTNKFGATSWNTMVYGTPRIAPRYVKARRKK